MRVFYVYLLHSLSDRGLYIGYSTDLRKRLNQHKQGASSATKTRGPWKLIYYEAYLEELDAKGRERYLKAAADGVFFAPNYAIISEDSQRET